MRGKTLVITAGALIAGATLYRSFLRDPVLTWGATAGRGDAARLPGDELLEDADGVATRAITIDAPAGGRVAVDRPDGARRRAAAPTPTTGSRTCSGSNMHSVDRVLPEFQHPQVGDGVRLRAEPDAASSASSPSTCSPARSADGNWVWTFVLERAPDGETRLISRNRFRLPTLTRPDRDAPDGARIARHGAEDAQGHQRASGEPGSQLTESVRLRCGG